MEWLNYHHLLYFWVLAREGSLARAAARLRLSQSTVSGQVRALETALGHELFTKSGRRLVLTDTGRIAFRYAEEIFGLGRELQDTLKGQPSARPLGFVVGIADVVPKLVAHRLLEPALKIGTPIRLVAREDKPDRLLAELAVHALDIVIADTPALPSIRVRAHDHLLAESGVELFAAPALAARYRKDFPSSLDGAPLLLPTENTALRRVLDQWFASRELRPQVMGEFEDSALLKVFGQAGSGIFPVHSLIAREVAAQYGVRRVGGLKGVKERFYAISVERRLRHPAAIALGAAAHVPQRPRVPRRG